MRKKREKIGHFPERVKDFVLTFRFIRFESKTTTFFSLSQKKHEILKSKKLTTTILGSRVCIL